MRSFPLQSSVAAAALLLAAATSTLAAAQSAPPDPATARGRRLFLQCASCHEIADTAIVKTGPNLKGVVGRPVASLPGYAYSPSLKTQSSFAWDDAMLDRWLQQPTQVAAETSMAFIGLPNGEDRKALIAYLRTLK